MEGFQSDSGWFGEWKAIFVTRQARELDIEVLSLLRSPDSIIGWTVANVAKRCEVDDTVPPILVQWLQQGLGEIPRWRIAHVLGAHPTRRSLEILLSLLDTDTDESVRYGTIRSIMELASRANPELRGQALEVILARVESIRRQPKIYEELRSSILLDRTPPNRDWFAFVTELIRAFFVVTDNTSERDLWRRYLSDAERLYLGRTAPEIEAGRFRRRQS